MAREIFISACLCGVHLPPSDRRPLPLPPITGQRSSFRCLANARSLCRRRGHRTRSRKGFAAGGQNSRVCDALERYPDAPQVSQSYVWRYHTTYEDSNIPKIPSVADNARNGKEARIPDLTGNLRRITYCDWLFLEFTSPLVSGKVRDA